MMKKIKIYNQIQKNMGYNKIPSQSKSDNSDVNGGKYVNAKAKFDAGLPSEKITLVHDVMIPVNSYFDDKNKIYCQIILQECMYEVPE